MARSIHSDGQRLIAETLRKARADAGLTQQQVADRLERPQSYVAKYESGERRLDLVELAQIGRVLRFDVSKLIVKLQAKT